MAVKRTWTVLGELIKAGEAHLQTGPFGTALKASEYVTDGVPLISVGEVRQGYFEVSDKTPRISPETSRRLPKFILNTGDIVFGRKGGIDRNAIVHPPQQGWFLGSDGIRLRLSDKHNSRFFSYQMRSPDTRAWLLQNSEGSTMPSLNQEILARVPIAIVPFVEQQQIAEILGALDEKIELNRRVNINLERTARALFKAWFVDFEPVRAKAVGARSYVSMPQATFDALSDRFTSSMEQEVPEGWHVDNIGHVVNVRGGATPSTEVESYWKGGEHCWLTPKDLSGVDDPVLLDTSRKITDAGVARIGSGLLPVGTVLLSSRAPVGYLVISAVPTAINQGFIAMVCNGPLPPLYVYHWTRSVMEEIKSRASGTTFPEISKSAFRPIRICVPPPPVLEAFTAMVQPFFEKLTSNIKESRALEKMRDYLLPKLLNGSVRVQDRSLSELAAGDAVEEA